MSIATGDIVTIHSLQSAGGQKLNGKDGLVIRAIKDDQGGLRFQVKVRGGKPVDSTTAIKPANLALKARLPLPREGGRPRGFVEDLAVGGDAGPIFAELLVMQTEHYDPPKTNLTGLPAMAFSELGQDHFTACTAIQMEWVAGTYAMGDLIKKSGVLAVEDVVFAILEGDPMYVDVFIILMTNTPFIGDPNQAKEKIILFHEFRDARHQLTPDQEHSAYIKALGSGPLYILKEAFALKLGAAFVASIKKSAVFHLLVQRFLRLVAREGMGTEDGKELGPTCRQLLLQLCQGMMPEAVCDLFKKGPLSMEEAVKLLDHTPEFNSLENMAGAFKSTLGALTHGETVSKYMSMLNMKRRK